MLTDAEKVVFKEGAIQNNMDYVRRYIAASGHTYLEVVTAIAEMDVHSLATLIVLGYVSPEGVLAALEANIALLVPLVEREMADARPAALSAEDEAIGRELDALREADGGSA